MNRAAALLLSASLLLASAFVAQGDEAKKPASVIPTIKSSPSRPEVEPNWLKRHAGFLKDKEETLKNGPIEVVFLGDSITDGWRNKSKDGTKESSQFKLFKERWGQHNPLNIGISGDRTEHVLWRLDNGEVDGIKPKVVVLMIGTNNLGNQPITNPDDTSAGVIAVVAKLREKLPESKVLLLGVFPRGMEANNPFRAQVDSVNNSIKKLDDGGKHVKYVDIGPAFLAADGTLTKEVMTDGLHPNGKGYQIWADSMGPELEKLMK